jgi:hypothetical protein
MICDRLGCKNTPMRAPRLVVPPMHWLLNPEWRPLKVMTALHYCEVHKNEPTADDILRPAIKLALEDLARKARPIGFQCDFEKAFIEMVLVTTPEYRAWLARLNIHKLVREAA